MLNCINYCYYYYYYLSQILKNISISNVRVELYASASIVAEIKMPVNESRTVLFSFLYEKSYELSRSL
jgi:hypothetical protein